MVNSLILWSMLIIPWFSLFLMKTDTFKRFTPVIILSSLMVTIVNEIGYTYQWWVQPVKIVPWGHITNVAFAYGFFAAGTYWIFYFTYGSFWLYMLVNLAIDSVWSFLVLPYILEPRGIAYLTKSNGWGILGLTTVVGIFIYGYQVWQESIFKEVEEPGRGKDIEQFIRRLLSGKGMAR